MNWRPVKPRKFPKERARLTEHPPSGLTYGVNDLPPWPRNILYGLQWLIVFLPTLVILAAISSEHLGLHGGEKVLFSQRILAMTGAVVVIQTLIGHRYPLLDGPASALLLSFLILAPRGLPTVQGGMMVGGLVLVLLSMCDLLRYLEALFTDNVVGVILILIAITIMPYVVPMVIGKSPSHPYGDPVVFAIAVTVILTIALFNYWLQGFPRTISLFLAVLLGTLLAGSLGRIDFPDVRDAQWLSLPQRLFPGLPTFSISATLTFLIAYLAVITNAVGSIYSTGEVVGKADVAGRLNRGIGVTGFGGLIAGILGVFGTVSYASSPGVVLITRVGSRFAVTVCGVLLFFLVFFQKALAILASIPASVVGAAMITVLAAQVGAGISVLARSGRLSERDYLVIGIPVLMGGAVSIFPQSFFETWPYTIHALLKNGLVVGIILVLVLEHLLLPRKR